MSSRGNGNLPGVHGEQNGEVNQHISMTDTTQQYKRANSYNMQQCGQTSN